MTTRYHSHVRFAFALPALALASLAIAQSCTVVNTFAPVKEEAASSGGGGGSAGGNGGDATTAGGGGQGGEATGGGGQGGAPEPCTLGDIGACGPGNKCTVISFNNQLTGCIRAGNKGAWEQCDDDGACAEGLWCDTASRQVCRPICDGVTDCANDGRCVDSTQFAGLKLCTSNCHPIDATPCATSDGVTCINGVDSWDCVVSGGGGFDTMCASSSDCAPGLVCIFTAQMENRCKLYCSPLGANPNCSGTCNAVGAIHNGTEFGACEQP